MNNIPSDVPNTSAPAEPEKPGNWLSKNFMPLLFVAAAIGVVIWKDLNISNTLIVVVGLGLVVFLHELGHFMAAKFCDVHVEAFSIGFGKAIPGCHFKYGETTYKIGYIPLGGYVKMVGEGDNADDGGADSGDGHAVYVDYVVYDDDGDDSGAMLMTTPTATRPRKTRVRSRTRASTSAC